MIASNNKQKDDSGASLDVIAATVKRLETNQTKTTDIQTEMAKSLAVMANTLETIEGTNIAIERLAGKIDLVFDALRKDENEKTEIFSRIRTLEDIGANPRLDKIEAVMGKCPGLLEVKARSEKILIGGVISVLLLTLGTIAKAVWK